MCVRVRWCSKLLFFYDYLSHFSSTRTRKTKSWLTPYQRKAKLPSGFIHRVLPSPPPPTTMTYNSYAIDAELCKMCESQRKREICVGFSLARYIRPIVHFQCERAMFVLCRPYTLTVCCALHKHKHNCTSPHAPLPNVQYSTQTQARTWRMCK